MESEGNNEEFGAYTQTTDIGQRKWVISRFPGLYYVEVKARDMPIGGRELVVWTSSVSGVHCSPPGRQSCVHYIR